MFYPGNPTGLFNAKDDRLVARATALLECARASPIEHAAAQPTASFLNSLNAKHWKPRVAGLRIAEYEHLFDF